MRTPILLAVCLAAPFLKSQDWPQWRGPQGDGIAPGTAAIPSEWSAKKNIKWRTPLAQPGNGSPIVSRGRVFVTMPEDDKGLRRSLYCFDARTGKKKWVRTVDFGQAMPTHPTNPHCSTTPAADTERVLVWHASAGFYCYDYAGKELWKRDLGEFRHQWGHGTSPVLYRNRVFLQSGPGAESFVAAFDKVTGKTLWRVVEPNHLTEEQIAKKRLAGTWCTPMIHRVGETDLLLCGQPTRLVAYDPDTGKVVWSSKGVSGKRGDLTYSSPVVGNGVCFLVGGWEGPTMGVRVGGEGDVTDSHRVWRLAGQMSNCATGMFADGAFFVPEMGGFLCCIDPKDGKRRWRTRVGRGNTWGSIVMADGKMLLTTQKGETVVFKPKAEKLEVLARNKIDEPTNSTPAVAGGEIFLRTHEALYCVANLAEKNAVDRK